jgi:hypothetical protein
MTLVLSIHCLTAVRLLLCPAFIVLFAVGAAIGYLWPLLVVLAIEGTGILAWRRAGRRPADLADYDLLLLPLADTLAHLTVYLCFLDAGLAPLWVVVVIFYGDSVVTYLRVTAATPKEQAQAELPPPGLAGHVRTFAHVLVTWAVFWVVLRSDAVDPFTVEATRQTCQALMSVVGVVTLWWTAARVWQKWSVLRDLVKPAR